MTARKVHTGARTLVIGFDVGTTFSGVSYSILEPGQVPVIKSVARFPGQEHVVGASKVPTAIFYDKQGIVRAEGAEIGKLSEQAEDEGWELAEWFKLHFLPPDARDGPVLNPLPRRQTATKVLADFLRYLFQCTKTFITESHPRGEALWRILEHDVQFVMAHPNGWEGRQQSQMRDAAVVAGLIPGSEKGRERLRFVTEGEASLHFCIQNGLAADAVAQGHGLVVVDAGGGTIDLSTYHMVKKNSRPVYEEIAPPQCLFHGSIYVKERAREYFQARLGHSRKFADDVGIIANSFDASGKLTFAGGDVSVLFGRQSDNDARLSINKGKLKIPAADAKQFFEPSIAAVVAAVRNQCVCALPIKVSSVFLVGGFAANDWLFSELTSRLASLRLDLVRPDTHVNKAVADGAVSFHIDHHVSVRVARATYGLSCSVVYMPENREHQTRQANIYRGVKGDLLVPGSFSTILQKGVQVTEDTEFEHTYQQRTKNRAAVDYISVDLYRYRGHTDPRWLDVDPEHYDVICKIEANTSRLVKFPKRRTGVAGSDVYELDFSVVLSFGLTELKAQIEWEENGAKKRGPAQILY
ncbi:hypothetical protein B0H15DRAFT_89843 [Mycena belliarum]|uniref:Uncharacterized protein n=1 Tax=Mycena belliarum TaxID=1033014 RepID=A0AAD6TS90_9AGAR|nr:hypothetical protein B0H15DRAFT_89843 [Mycena belliae]